MASQAEFKRLPESVIPTHYDICLKTMFEEEMVEGEMEIAISVKERVKEIVLNTADLSILEAEVAFGAKKMPINVFVYDKRWSTSTLKLPESVDAGLDGLLKIKFNSAFSKSMRGFYISTYRDTSGNTATLVSTQFEADDARSSFPCWDEPRYKATYDVRLIVPSDKIALSNEDAVETRNLADGSKVVRFGRTPLMSTYLVAFAVGDFEYLERYTKRGVRVRVYAVRGKTAQGHFALEVACKTLDYFEQYFGSNYQLSKCDLVAIPDFAMGAMENWGMITFREIAILVDPEHSSAFCKQEVALTVAHELAHMWFGNLVTMTWWTDLWLKEGFATWMEAKAVDHLYPELDVWTQFAECYTTDGLKFDSMQYSHPIEVPINEPCEIEEAYDSVSYNKGCSVVNMLEKYLGPELFKEGVRHYLKKHAYSTAEALDLWRSFSEISGQDVAGVMSAWTKQMGYPVIQAELEQQDGEMMLCLKQERFLFDGSTDKESLWKVPISFVGPNFSEPQTYLLEGRTGKVVLTDFKDGDWLKLNLGFSGFFRVQYSAPMMDKLWPLISTKVLAPVDRMQICNDAFALARAGRISHVHCLEMLLNYKNEDDYTVWSSVLAGLHTMLTCAEGTELAEPLHAYCRDLLNRIMAELTWNPRKDEKHTCSMLRSLIFNLLASCKDKSVLQKAEELFESHIKDKQPLVPDLRSVVYNAACAQGGLKEVETLVELYKTAEVSEVQRDCLRALGRSGDPAVLKRVEELLNSDVVRLQDLHNIFRGMNNTCAGREYAWKYFQANMKSLADRYGGTKRSLFQLCVQLCTQDHCTKEKADEVKAFFDDPIRKDSALTRVVSQSLENIRLNMDFLQIDSKKIHEWLSEHGY